MLSWGRISLGALLTALFGGGGVLVFGGHRRARTALLAAVGAGAAATGWNAIARVTRSSGLASEAQWHWFPASWRALGSGVYAVAVVTVLLGATLRRTTKAYQLLLPALLCGVAAFLVDVYLY